MQLPDCRRLLCTCLLSLIGAAGTSAQSALPQPLPGVVPPAYPDAAQYAGIEGDVAYRAAIDARGVVTAVDILSVPAAGFGFEDAVRRAVSAWRFSPAVANGIPVAGVFEATATFTGTLPGEFVFPVTPTEAWAALRALVQEFQLKSEMMNEKRQVVVTRRGRYRDEIFPKPEAVGRPDRLEVREIQWHLAAPPGYTRARVVIGVVTILRRTDGVQFTVYNDETLVHWLRAKLSDRLGHAGEPMAAGPTRRANQSPLATVGPEDTACPTLPGPPVSKSTTGQFVRPTLVYAHQPVYPLRQRNERTEGVVRLAGIVTEHGTLSRMEIKTREVPEEMQTTTVGAASLWRFTPARLNGCAVMTEIEIEMSFAIK